MHTNKQDVLTYLLSDACFRERKNKNKGFANLLITKYPALRTFERERIIDILIDYATMNRWWNRLLQTRPDLRGKDYNEKYHLQSQAKSKYDY